MPTKRLAFSNGFVNGYLTMDTLGAMVFGIVIVNAARSVVTEARLLTRYTIWAGLMAGVGLTLLYLALFRLVPISATLGRSEREWCGNSTLTFSTPLAVRAACCWRP